MNTEDIVHYTLLCGDWEQSDLARMAHVSRIWLHPVRRFLLTHPRLTSRRACALLARTLTTSPALAYLVRALHLSLGESIDPSIIFSLLQAARNIEALALHNALTYNAEQYLLSIPYPNKLTSLCISHAENEYAIFMPVFVWGDDFDVRFPNLKSLDLRVVQLRIPTRHDKTPPVGKSESDFEEIHRMRLEHLSLSEVEIKEGLLSHITSASSWDRLRSLKVVAERLSSYDGHVVSLFQSGLSALKTLHLQGLMLSRAYPFRFDREIVIPTVRQLTLLNPFEFEVILMALMPPTVFPGVEVLTIGASSFHGPEATHETLGWVHSLKTFGLKQLKVIEVVGYSNSTLFENICREYGVQFRPLNQLEFHPYETNYSF